LPREDGTTGSLIGAGAGALLVKLIAPDVSRAVGTLLVVRAAPWRTTPSVGRISLVSSHGRLAARSGEQPASDRPGTTRRRQAADRCAVRIEDHASLIPAGLGERPDPTSAESRGMPAVRA
jgi:hypothetical protein